MRQLSGLPIRLHVQILLTLLAGLLAGRLLGAFSLPAAGMGALLLLLLLAALCGFSPWVEVQLAGQRLTLAPVPVFLAQLLLGTGPAVMVAGLGALVDALVNPEGKRERKIGEAPTGYGALFHLGNACL